MRYVRVERRRAWPSWWALLFLLICCAASTFITFRVGAQTRAAVTLPQPATGPAARPEPSKPEESATIPDDPTLVPDDKENADNNVTFPIDI